MILHEVLRAAVMVLVTDKLLRFVADPDTAPLRLLPLPDEGARALHRVLLTLVLIVAVVGVVVRTLAALGLAQDGVTALALALLVLPSAWLVAMVWRHRAAVTATLAERLGFSGEARQALTVWPALATFYLVLLYAVTAGALLRGEGEIGLRLVASVAAILLVPLLAWLVQGPLLRLYGLDRPEAAPSAEEAQAAEAHVRRLMRAVWVVLLLGGVLLTALAWGIDLRESDLGGVLFRLLANVGAMVLLGYVAWALILRWIDQQLEASRRDADQTRGQRLLTLLPLLRKFVQVVLFAMVTMIVLSSLGIDIGPLIAGAGVVGIAIGFGAQSTIANILTGVSFLMVDAFRLGDYVEMGNIRGRVEGITLTALKLRHHRGAVHTLPFAQIKSLTNYSRDWMLMRLEFRVPPTTDLALVKKLVKDIGREIAADPEPGPPFIEPLKSQGVRRVEDNAIVIGIKYIAKPDGVWLIRREAYQRLLKAFQAHGIELVGHGVVVKVEAAEAVAPAAMGAAAQVIQDRLAATAKAG